MRIYVDGIFDLFHVGHVKMFKYIKERWVGCSLIAGVINDKTAEDYKRLPIIKNRLIYKNYTVNFETLIGPQLNINFRKPNKN